MRPERLKATQAPPQNPHSTKIGGMRVGGASPSFSWPIQRTRAPQETSQAASAVRPPLDAAEDRSDRPPEIGAIQGADAQRGTEAERGTDDADREKRTGPSRPGEALSDEDQRAVQKLKARDREVRAHEQAHKSVGGVYAGAIRYDYQTGPDQKRYAIGGEVSIDVSPVPNNPRATITKMQIVHRAALAPAEPSAADRAVAAEARRKEFSARAELARERQEGPKERGGPEVRAYLNAGVPASTGAQIDQRV